MNQDSISVIIPFHGKNNFSDLVKCIDSIHTCNIRPKEIIVVLNGFITSELEQKIELLDVIIVSSYLARNSYEARNSGARVSTGDILCFLDDDVVVSKNFFIEIQDNFSSPMTMMSGGKVVFTEEEKVSFITANMCVRSRIFFEMKGFKSVYSGGDIEFHKRVSEKYRTELSINRVAYHKPEDLFMRVRKSLRYGSGTTSKKLFHQWNELLKNFILTLFKSIGFIAFKITKKPFGKL